MAMDIQTLSPEQAQQMRTRSGRVNFEQVIYYRKPNGWITWNGSQASKQLDFISRGFQPLAQYGFIRADSDAPDYPANAWHQILQNPKGIREFPVEQILSMRWHRDPPIKGLRFPQLGEWIREGNEIVEYSCPECSISPYADPLWLARHLKNAHSYTQMEIIAIGDKLGIDFARVITRGGRRVFAYEADLPEETHEAYSQPSEPPAYEIKTVNVEKPKLSYDCDCGWTPKPTSKNRMASLMAHKRNTGHA